MNKSFIAALAFAACALVFLIAMVLRQSNAKADYEAAFTHWNGSQAARQEFVNTAAAARGTAPQRTGAVDLPTVFGELARQIGIDTPEISRQGSARGQARHSVVFQRLTLDTMGDLLDAIRRQHRYLTVRSIDASRGAGFAIAEFKWTLEIASPE